MTAAIRAGLLPRLPPPLSRLYPAARFVHLAVRWLWTTCSRAASGPPRSASTGTVTTPPLRASPVVEDMLTSCLRDILRTIHAVATTHSHRGSGDRRRSSAVRPRDTPGPVHAAATLAVPSHIRCRQQLLTARLRGHPPDHPRGCDDPSPRASRADDDVLTVAFGIAFGSSARVYRPRSLASPQHSRFRSARQPSRASRSSGPGVEDGGQDKSVVPRRSQAMDGNQDFRCQGQWHWSHVMGNA